MTLPSDRAAISGMPPGGAPPARPSARYDQPQSEGQPWWIWLLALLAVILLGTIGFLGAQVLGGLGSNSSPTPIPSGLAVPQWIGDPIAGVQEQANQLGLVLDKQTSPSDTVAVDHVISTAPQPGTPVRVGDHVKVTVSSGKEQVPVPNMIGQTRAEANSTLQTAGLILGLVSNEPSDRPAGEVIRTSPSAGVSVGKGSQVDLVLSSGPTPSPIPTPSPTPVPPTPSPTPCPTPVGGPPPPCA